MIPENGFELVLIWLYLNECKKRVLALNSCFHLDRSNLRYGLMDEQMVAKKTRESILQVTWDQK